MKRRPAELLILAIDKIVNNFGALGLLESRCAKVLQYI